MPPWLKNPEGKARRVGIELEMSGLILERLTTTAADFLQLKIETDGRYARILHGDDAGEQRVFAYGTLGNPLIRLLITRELTTTSPAHLPGYRKQGLDIIEADTAKTKGVVFSVTPQGLRRLDRYERVGERYQRLLVTLTDGEPAWVYQRLKD